MNGQQTTGATKDLQRSRVYTAKHAGGDDHLLVAVAKAGHPNAFGALYERHRLRIYQTALRILRNAQDAEDAAQRSFQRAFTNLSRFREDSTFLTWLTRITINEALMMLRQRRTNIRIFEGNGDRDYGPSAFDVPDKGPTPEEALSEHEVGVAVTQAISHLRKTLRTVVVLRDLHGLTGAETARRLGLSLAAVKARTFDARRHLRRHFERKFKGVHTSFLIGARD